VSVFLVGAGPGSADLLTLRAARLLKAADVVIFDRLVDPSVLELVNPLAQLIDVGKVAGRSFTQTAINDLLVEFGSTHQTVVRLKGGDPFLFGRGGEEAAAMYAAGIACEVIPGVTSALSAPAAAGIPVTHRGLSQSVTIVTGHGANGTNAVDWQTYARIDGTLVVLMGVEARADIASALMLFGKDPSTPVAAIESAFTSKQRTIRTTLAELGNVIMNSPATIVIGAVAALPESIAAAFATSPRPHAGYTTS
jgi:uroporphyrin-III C-methyltransferase